MSTKRFNVLIKCAKQPQMLKNFFNKCPYNFSNNASCMNTFKNLTNKGNKGKTTVKINTFTKKHANFRIFRSESMNTKTSLNRQ